MKAKPGETLEAQLGRMLRAEPTRAGIIAAVRSLQEGLSGSIAANKTFLAEAEALKVELRELKAAAGGAP